MRYTKEELEKQKFKRLGQIRTNMQGCLMQCVEYNEVRDIKVMFLDDYQYVVKSQWHLFNKGIVKNPYSPSIIGVGIVGNKYALEKDRCNKKEYITWVGIIRRSYDKKLKEKYPTYENVTCCDEWLLYDNFYEWLHSQENFEKWLNGDRWAVDKDILIKGNKVYSPETCCLVPQNVNALFIKSETHRGNLPIGVRQGKKNHRYYASTIYGRKNNSAARTEYSYPTPEEAFYLGYKPSKEDYIKRVAQEEYDKGNITEKCYNAMMNYEVEITD